MKKEARGKEQSRKGKAESRAAESAGENKKNAQPISRKAPEEMK